MSHIAFAPKATSPCAEFRMRLKDTWHCVSYDGRDFINTRALTSWLKRKDTHKEMMHAATLLKATFEEQPEPQLIFGENLIEEGKECLCVFSLLLEMECAHLIGHFRSCGITDGTLYAAQHKYDLLRTNLKRQCRYTHEEIEDIQTKFDKLRWKYCPISMEFEMQRIFEDGKWIFPFCRSEAIVQADGNQKGGTAHSVWQVSIREACLPLNMQEKLSSSAYEDDDFGQCYRLAIKKYHDSNWRFFNWETKAFLTLREQPGMVQYFGQYSIKEGNETFHNIVMEYGEADLDEYFASTNPPVTAEEMFDFWKSLFKVAEALDRLHNLPRALDGNEKEHLNGWHADVKPDNILKVNNEYKLADFGFAKFTSQSADTTAMEFLNGGTEAYGAPEQFRASKTMTPVDQTVDIWSFGTTLSIAVTWVVLGFDGIRQFENLRRLANLKLVERKRRGEKIDIPRDELSFHDGHKLLPEVRRWHDFLRDHKRACDTVTDSILDLIEKHLLREKPTDRLKSRPLCEALDKLLKTASELHDQVLSESPWRATDPIVLQALLCAERQKEESVSSRTGRTGAYNSLLGLSPSHEVRRHVPSAALRRGKASKLENAQTNRTARRTKVLEATLDMHPDRGNRPMTPPLTCTREEKDDFVEDESKPGTSLNGLVRLLTVTETEPEGRPLEENPKDIVQHQPDEVPPSAFHDSPEQLPHDSSDPIPSFSTLKDLDQNPTGPGSSVKDNDNSVADSRSVEIRPSQALPQSDIPKVSEITPDSIHHTTPVESATKDTSSPPNGDGTTGDAVVASAVPSIPALLGMSSINGDRADFTLHPHLEVVQIHEALRSERAKAGPLRPWKKPDKDKWLKDYIKDRDIIFVVDNGSCMFAAWAAVTLVVETLVMKFEGLDKDGLDFRFAFSSDLDLENVKNLKKIMANMKHAGPQENTDPDERRRTDMGKLFGDIFERYKERFSKPEKLNKAVTLIVLTDGRWEGTPTENYNTEINERLVKFLRHIKGRQIRGGPSFTGSPFTIQFIRFGGDADTKRRLKELDDQLPKDFPDIGDVIDEVSWQGKVKKMLVGSILPYFDQMADDSSDIENSSSGAQAARNSTTVAVQDAGPSTPQRNHSNRVNNGQSASASRTPRSGFFSKMKNFV